MIHRFGDRCRFAIEIGDVHEGQAGLRQVDVWAADRWLTCDDNTVYVPHFIGMLEASVGFLLRDLSSDRLGRPYPESSVVDNFRRLRAEAETENTEYLAYRFMDWGPTADNVSMLLFRESGTAFLPFAFWREAHHDPTELGQVFVAELPERELAYILHEAAWQLMWEWVGRSKSTSSN